MRTRRPIRRRRSRGSVAPQTYGYISLPPFSARFSAAMMPSGEQTVARRLAAAAQPPLRLAGETTSPTCTRQRGNRGVRRLDRDAGALVMITSPEILGCQSPDVEGMVAVRAARPARLSSPFLGTHRRGDTDSHHSG